MLNTKTSINKHLSNTFTKAQRLKQLIDKVVFDRSKCLLILQNTKMMNYITKIQKYEVMKNQR